MATFRISTNYIYSSTNRSIQDSVTNLLKAEEQMASQRKINHLSDNPVDAGRVINARTMISQQEAFLRNIDLGQTFADLYDGALETTVGLISRAKELLLGQANSAASTPQTREAARIELVSLASQLVNVGNLQYGDRFLFAGYADSEAPFLDLFSATTPAAANAGGGSVVDEHVSDPSLVTGDGYQIVFQPGGLYDVVDTTTATPVVVGATYVSGQEIQFDGLSVTITDSPGAPAAGDVFDVSTTPAGTYVGDSGVVEFETEQDVRRQVNLTGDRVFLGQGLPNGIDLFAIFERANQAMRNDDQVEINALLQEFDDALEQVTSQQSIVGSRMNLLQSTEERLLDVKTRIEVLESDLVDVEITEAVMELNRRENAYQAVLSATSKTLQPSLLDFL